MKLKKNVIFALLAVAFVYQAGIQRLFLYDNWVKNYAPKNNIATPGLDPQQLLFALAGFREMIAGILWVRADSFFDTGNYDAILPLIRLVTILDPHQIDVYATGMWHIGYNFTDEGSRGDRRYIPAALALGAEGARQNPETYEMFFETGWMWYHRIDDDYSNAVNWFNQARERKDMLPARKNLLASALLRDGKVLDAVDQWYALLEAAEERFQADDAYGNRQIRDSIRGNLDTLLVRMAQRGWLAANTPEGRQANWWESGEYDTKPPFDVGFSVKVSVIEPRKVAVIGSWGVLPVGTRIRMILRDKDYAQAKPGGMNWDQGSEVYLDPPKDSTFMYELLFVRNRKFEKTIDMSRDPTMYPFKQPNYVVEFYYNPRSAPPHIQDKFGWNGEGMTDQRYLNTQIRPGQRVIFHQMELSRDMIMRQNEWLDRTPVLKTPNFVEPNRASSTEEEIIRIPALRSANPGTGN
jgi:hypothetical protein